MECFYPKKFPASVIWQEKNDIQTEKQEIKLFLFSDSIIV